jgi:hypothetical protein
MSTLSPNESRILDLIQRNKDNWIIALEEMKKKGKLDRFMDHYLILDLIQKIPLEMAAFLLKIDLGDWYTKNLKGFPREFIDHYELDLEMRKLGFD